MKSIAMKSITIKEWFEIPKNYTGHIKHTDGSQAWYKNGKLHREDGPAIIWSDGMQGWCLDGIHYTKEDYYKELYKRGLITEQELFVELL